MLKKAYTQIQKLVIETKWREKKSKKGKIDDGKTYYVIRRMDDSVGLFSYYITVLGNIKYAFDRGYIPVIDMMNYKSPYIKENQIGKVNAWEFFFTQPANVSVTEAMTRKRVILGSGSVPKERPSVNMECYDQKGAELKKWRELASSITLSDKAQDFCDSEYKKIINPSDIVLGVKLRGTDYIALKLKGHPIQPTIDIVIEKIDEMRNKHKVTKIFVATEDPAFIDELRKQYGEMVITNEVHYVKYDGTRKITNGYNNDFDDSKLTQGMEYLATTYILSRCKYFVGGRNSGSLGAMIMSHGYDDSYVFDLGVY